MNRRQKETLMKMDKNNLIKIISTLSFLGGVVAGMVLMFALFYAFTDNLISTILGNIQIENINFDLNETALVEAMNKTFGGSK